MVEKWLVQVEDLMVKSMRAIALDAVAAYFNSPRSLWVLNWPGMIVLCGSSIHWTAEVSESITKGTLKVFFQKFKNKKKIISTVRLYWNLLFILIELP